ncbi:MAG: AI-2E family transporter [Gammaproteobacteria bacterium]|nr:AI-2E family transporter [Gammaproteobacteria bacterium]
MVELVNKWFRRYFYDPQIVFLVLFLMVALAIVLNFNDILAPVFFAIVLAYLMEGIILRITKVLPYRMPVVITVFITFITLLLVSSIVLIPLIWEQLAELIKDMPANIDKGKLLLLTLPEKYSFITENHIGQVISFIQGEMTTMGKTVVSFSLSSLQDSVTIIIYLILVPLLIFFFLKDKKIIMSWFTSFLPKKRDLSSNVWDEMDLQIGNYVRGKFWEIVIVGGFSFLAFTILGLKYALLMAVLVGLSVIVPYIGATVVTFPVAIVAFFQWGWTSDFAWLMIVYAIIQAIDGNVIVPLLFSEVVNVHPVAIIVAVLFFGGLWGFWGVFFAIPLATLVNSVIRAWPEVPEV